VVRTTRPYRAEQAALLNDARPNGELLLATGAVQRDNPSDCLELPASLVPIDRLYTAKVQVLEAMGMQVRACSALRLSHSRRSWAARGPATAVLITSSAAVQAFWQ
jgi:hypothetical protein